MMEVLYDRPSSAENRILSRSRCSHGVAHDASKTSLPNVLKFSNQKRCIDAWRHAERRLAPRRWACCHSSSGIHTTMRCLPTTVSSHTQKRSPGSSTAMLIRNALTIV
jgi:hypothetical protein